MQEEEEGVDRGHTRVLRRPHVRRKREVVGVRVFEKSAPSRREACRRSTRVSSAVGSSSSQFVRKYGERGSGFRPRGEVQDFEKIRDRCLQSGTLFEDPDFQAEDSSIFFSRSCPGGIRWKRPSEICDEPRLFVEGASRFDVVQGELGDCWLLAAVANLTLNDALFFRVVPNDQSFVKDYAGVFHFRFWQYGRWVDIVVDDRLPTCGGRLVFMHSKNNNEFWSALLEKAYAKLHGSYEALKGGTACEAMEDFTGGVSELYELDKAPANFFKILLKAFERWSLMSCSIEPDPNVLEMEMDNGLIKGHAYSITKVKLVDVQTPRVKGKIPLLRVRNPWGNECEWKGAWSDRSQEWSLISPDEKEELGLRFDSDGEFWISYKDFMSNFHRVEICNLNPDSLDDEPLTKKSKKKWEMSMFEGSWTKNCTAGGCRNFIDTFWMNPQFRIVLEDVDEEDDDDLCTCIIALMQKNRRCRRKMGEECLTIGFAIYQLKNPDRLPKPLPKSFFQYNASIARSNTFINLREVSCRFKLPPGTYCIIPSTFDPAEEGDFVLRVFTEKKNLMTEYDEEIGMDKPDEDIQVPETPEELDKDKEVRDFFAGIAGEDLEVDCYELQEILDFALKKEFTFDGFSLDVCRSMVAMMDVDRSGKLGLEEFKNLWVDIRTWKNVFKRYDVDHSGSLNTIELRAALHSAGYRLNFHVLRALVLRYGKKGKVCFDDFIMCAVKLKTMIETFQERDPRKTMKATFTLDEWVEKTMYS
ncbi:LOW QUALITY PROTEIN: calpain-A-like [Uloborus diversus]|uniref:LOW QUALITY PROTEIN: calpain-A-like n=1 Tax=Uloborus diversus TaxID=327109 RepID=UPI00240A7E62|nr:LOW QUALITY PROTEIN: calpain-A-like [Uloborus diversus]